MPVTRSIASAGAMVVAIAIASSVVSTAEIARADDPPSAARCSEAYVAGQHLQHDGRLIEAARELLICARAPCSQTLQPECAEWLGDVQRSLPSIVIAAKGSRGEDLRDVRVTVDNHPFLDRLDGAAKDIDPGDHAFHLETMGESAIDQRVLVRAGEKSRLLSFQFRSATPPPTMIATTPAIADAAPATPWPAYAFGGLAVVAAGSFAYFGLHGLSLWNDCHVGCAQAHVDAGNRSWIAADVSAGVAVVSLGLSLYFILRPVAAKERPAVSFAIGPKSALIRGNF